MTATAGLMAAAEAAGGGSDADQRVVFAILDRVDRVVAERPEDERAVEQRRRPGVISPRAGGRGDQRAPVEGEAEPDLRPPGDALHQRIERDHGDGAERDEFGEIRQAEQDRQADGALGKQPDPGLLSETAPEGSGRRAVRATFASMSAIEDVVVGAARAAHGDGADDEQEGEPGIAGAKSPGARARARPMRQGRPSSQKPAGRS